MPSRSLGREVEDSVSQGRQGSRRRPDGEGSGGLVEKAFEELPQAVTKEGLKAVQSVVKTTHTELEKLENNKPALVGAINNLGGKVEIGPITLAYANFYTRTELVAGVLDQYINHPPGTAARPDHRHGEGPRSPTPWTWESAFRSWRLVVGSKELGVGGGLNGVRQSNCSPRSAT